MASAKPVHKIRAGAISCALWENDIVVGGRKIRVLKATVERRYKDGEEWKSSNSFGVNEVARAIWCLQKAYDHMLDDANNRTDENLSDEETVA
jgi:hypothetical protein